MTKFTEVQAFSAVAYGALGLSAVAVVAATGAGLVWPVLPLGLTVNLLCQRTIVTDTELSVSFGALFPLYRRRIPLHEIASAQADTYAPLAEYGGWGIKGAPGNSALNARGDQSVRLTLRDGKRILVGSQRPGELAEALTAPR
jgi:hypothetical protein